MKFLNFTSKKDTKPALGRFRPMLFDIKFYWGVCLLLFILIIVITAVIGSMIFYSEYTEDYKVNSEGSNTGNLINTEKLKNLINKRNDFINQPVPILKDPSI